MTREVKNGKDVAFKGGQCERMDHRVWQVVPGTNNTVRDKVFGGMSQLTVALRGVTLICFIVNLMLLFILHIVCTSARIPWVSSSQARRQLDPLNQGCSTGYLYWYWYLEPKYWYLYWYLND